MMRQTIAAAMLMLAAAAAAAGQAPAASAQEEINHGATAYRRGDFAEAQRRFERALELDPSNKNALLFAARAVQQQYKPGDQTPENVAKGMEAVAAYERVLERDPADEDAYRAVFFLHTKMKNEERLRELLLRRANDDTATPEQRADALSALASKQWQCSYDITEKNKGTQEQKPEQKPEQSQERKPEQNQERKQEAAPAQAVVKYKRPADASDFLRAQQCVSEGLILSDQATRLSPDSLNAWTYRANLLREAAKLAEMEGNAYQQAEYNRQHEEALARQRAARGQARDKGGPPLTADSYTPPPIPAGPAAPRAAAAAPARRTPVVAAGVLNSKALSKPEPAFPPEAKSVRAQVVTVRVRVDERGNVTEAHAVSGDPLLRPAAVEAARRARFAPLIVRGKPAQFSGTLTYNFAPR